MIIPFEAELLFGRHLEGFFKKAVFFQRHLVSTYVISILSIYLLDERLED